MTRRKLSDHLLTLSPAVRYFVAVAAAVVAILLRLALDPVWGSKLPYITFFPAIMLSAWVGGLWPGTITTMIAGVAVVYFWIEPIRSWAVADPNEFVGLLVFAGVGVTISVLNESWRRSVAIVLKTRGDADRARHEAEGVAYQKTAILESALDAIIAMDQQGLIVDFNPAAERIFGYRRDDVIGKTVADTIIPERLREAHWHGLRRFLETGDGPVLGTRIEMPAIRSDNREFPAELSIAVSHSKNAQPLFTAQLRDITERRHAEEERAHLLNQEHRARADAEQANRLKDEFLATISHELRTPLNAILGWAAMLEQTMGEDARAVKGLQSIHRNARMLVQLVDDVLDVSRIITGKLRLDLAPMDLADAIHGSVEAVLPAATAKNIRIDVEADPAARAMVGDATRLQQVVWNLLSNAIKFTSPGGRVEVSTRWLDGEIELAVRDTGIGIDPSFLPYVFDRFRQADASTTRAHGGLGLGLAIARHLVELHGGTVRAESGGRDTGATFVIALPVRRSTADDGGDRPAAAATAPAGPGRRGLSLAGVRVLVVDDDGESCDVMQAALRMYGASVRVAMSADEAIEAAATFVPDVVLTDIAMPGRDGYSMLADLRAREAESGRRVPVAAVTAFARLEDHNRATTAGFDGYLTKPVDPLTLASTVATLASGSARR